MLVVFEGIDGSGKTTLSNRVAKALARRGTRVKHVREGGKLASSTAESIRLLARDQRNAALAPVAEMLLYAARDAQQLDEAMRPALAEADVVIADRFAYTAYIMATAGRGLPEEYCRPIIDLIARGVQPDLVVLVDVETFVARARRRVSKIAEPSTRPPSRKGLSGEGLMQRLRAGYLDLARREPERWIIVENSDAPLDATVDALIAAIDAAQVAGVAAARTALTARLETAAPPVRSGPVLADARQAFLAWIDRRALREPALAAYFLGGLAGPGYDERRLALVEQAPAVMADGLGGLDDAVSWQLRDLLAEIFPGAIARSLVEPATHSPRALALREKLAPIVPIDVLASLKGQTSTRAWELREQLAPHAPHTALASLRGDSSERAWHTREEWIVRAGGERAFADPLWARAACQSVSGLADERAWDLREAAFACAPAAALSSLWGLTDERAWRWREKWVERAPRPVLRSLDGVDDPRAYALRSVALPFAPDAIGSLRELVSEAAWKLREAALDRWPVAVAKSLAGMAAATPRGQAILLELLTRFPTLVPLWKHAGAAIDPDQGRMAATGG